jgi:hypothetical protein
MQSPLIFGPFGTDLRLPLLRNLRSIRIDVLLDVQDHWAVKRQRARLEYFISILKQHSDDANKKSLLHELTVNFLHGAKLPSRPLLRYPHTHYPLPPSLSPDVIERFMFTLESLVSLTRIKLVTITGVPEWFATCLQLCISGKGGEVKETDWPDVQVTRSLRTWCKKKKTVWVTSRRWYQPVFNWKEFAERNGVEAEDVERFWAAND